MERDVIVVGGSYAGMSAALQLARARRTVTIIDAGERRNRFAPHAHGFLTRDGADPAEIAAIGRRQLEAYPTVQWIDGTAVNAAVSEGVFSVATSDGGRQTARRMLLALGARDVLPEIPGLAERWGRSVFHCPYCHGYELDRAPIGVLATSPLSMHQALLLPEWGPTTFFLNDVFELDAEQLTSLERRGVKIERGRVASIAGVADVVMSDGRVISVSGLFTASRTYPSTEIGAALGCAYEDGATGRFLKVDDMKRTSVAGVFACGDAARLFGNIATAVGEGAFAGAAVHQSLMIG